MRKDFGAWVGFVNSQGALSKEERVAFDALSSFLESLETTEMSKSFKMIVLTAMLKNATAVSSAGGRFSLEDNGETPDTQDALIEYPDFTAVWSHREASAGQKAA